MRVVEPSISMANMFPETGGLVDPLINTTLKQPESIPAYTSFWIVVAILRCQRIMELVSGFDHT